MGIIREVFVDSLKGDGVDKVVGAACWLLVILAAFCVLALMDSAFAKTDRQIVRVVDKNFVAAHTTFIPQVVGNSTILTPIHNPDSWRIKVSNGGNVSSCKVDIVTFSEAKEGDSAYAYVGGGLFTDQEYCEKFQLIYD